MKKVRWLYLLVSLIPVALGIVCFIVPGVIKDIICYVAGALMLGYGLVKVIRYFASKTPTVDGLILGAIFGMLGVLSFLDPETVGGLISTFIGIMLILDGIIKLKNTFLAKSAGGKDWLALLIMALIVLGFGILIVADPFKEKGIVPVILLGVGAVLDGVQNLYAAVRLAFPVVKTTSDLPKTVTAEYHVEEE